MQPTDPFTAFLEALIFWWQLWGWRVIPIIGVILVWIILIITYGILRRVLKNRARIAGVPPDAINGLILAIGFGLIYVGVIAFMVGFPDIFSYFVVILGTSSLIIGAAIGIAVGQAVRNFVSGLYVIFSRPFHVEDYVKIGDKEGIVKEISMNYTKLLQPDGSDILVPNSKVLDSEITNFMFEKQKLAGLLENIEEVDRKQRSVLRQVSKVIEVEKIVRYVFPMAFHTSQDLRKLRDALDQVCKKWGTKFGFRPVYEITEVEQFAFKYNFVLFSDNARKILEFKPAFMDEILNAIFISKNT
ncbi:MAG: mechanosensitive ion channel [Candidatus Hermodarchaeota archaeon]|nr:mechanosensitive ion channel [Candidatus Hermodarchaeota archaeon]